MTRKTRPVLVAVVSDVHAGGSTALAPDAIKLDDGGLYVASKAQQWLMGCWQDYWAKIAAKRDELKAELYVVFNGDLVDGQVKGSTQVVSGNPNAQAAIVTAAMSIPLALKPDRIAIIRGTAAHVGLSASAEERIADGLRRDKRPIVCDPDTNSASMWHWRPELQGVRLDFTHHGRMGRLPRTRGSQLVLYAWDITDEHVQSGHPVPHLAFRAHNHKKGDTGGAAPCRVVATGAWQLGTEFVHRIASDSLADIGGAYVVIDRGDYDFKHVHFQPERRVWLA